MDKIEHERSTNVDVIENIKMMIQICALKPIYWASNC